MEESCINCLCLSCGYVYEGDNCPWNCYDGSVDCFTSSCDHYIVAKEVKDY